MKRRPGLILLILALCCACVFSSQRRYLRDGEQEASEGHAGKAFTYFELAMHGTDSGLALEAARRGVRLAQVALKKYEAAIELYRFIIVASDSDDERKSAEMNIAQIYFENLLNYEKAVIEYEKLLRLEFPPAQKYLFRLNIAKSQHQLGNLEQALAELDMLSKGEVSDDNFYDLQVFRGEVLMSEKKQSEAAPLFEELIKKYPDRAAKESLGLTLAVCYEEMDDFKRAISALEGMKKGYSHPEFLDTRIARLKSRMSNMPLANGYKK